MRGTRCQGMADTRVCTHVYTHVYTLVHTHAYTQLHAACLVDEGQLHAVSAPPDEERDGAQWRCGDMCVADVCAVCAIGMHTGMCADMCAGMCAGMCADIYVCRHVYGHVCGHVYGHF